MLQIRSFFLQLPPFKMTRVHLARVLSSAGLTTILVPSWQLTLTVEKPQLPYFYMSEIISIPPSFSPEKFVDQ